MLTPDALLAKNNHCTTCDRKFDNPDDPLSLDCGGHCVKCLADAGDPECVELVKTTDKASED